MPPKYSHIKKRPAPRKKTNKDKDDANGGPIGSPHVDRGITQALSAVSKLERTIARILLLRYEQDIARLFSTRLYTVSLIHLPTFVMRCVSLGGPGWAAHNADCEEIKDFFRAAISMDMRQAGERVATKSVLWSYTALRHFAMSNNVHICQKRGLHSIRLLPHYDALKGHMDSLEALPPPQFSKPPHLGPLLEGEAALEEACEIKYGLPNTNGKSRDKKGKNKENENDTGSEGGGSAITSSTKSKLHNRRFDFTLPFPFNQSPSQLQNSSQNTDPYDPDWRPKVLLSYEKLVQTLWRVAREFDVRGYGTLLREKLTTKWCDCGCSTDHLGEVCERTVREEEEWMYARAQHNHGHSHSHSGGGGSEYDGKGKGKEKARLPRGKGKQREWDGRGSGVFGWDTPDEEDIWEIELDFGGSVGPGFEHRDGDDSDDDHQNSGSKRNKRDKVKTGQEKEKEREAESVSLALGMGMEGFGFEQDLRDMTISEVMEWRYLRAEKEKEAGNAAFRKGDYEKAVEGYEKAYKIEPEMPHYQLNLGMAYLKLNNWIKAEEACTKSLGQHKSAKGYFRRAKARKMLGRTEDAARDLRAVLKLQPTNIEAQNELLAIYPPEAPTPEPNNTGSSTSMTQIPNPHIPTPKPPKPLPFPRTSQDERKMKIVQFPAALDSQVLDLAALFGGPNGQQGNNNVNNSLNGIGGLSGLSGLGPFPPGMSPTNYYYANGYGDGEYGLKNGKGGKGKKEHGPHGHGCTCGNRHRGRGAGSKESEVGNGEDGNGEKREKTKEEKEKADRAWKRQKELEKLRATPGMMYPGWERYVVKRLD